MGFVRKLVDAVIAAKRMRDTPIVDDDFPEVRDDADRKILNACVAIPPDLNRLPLTFSDLREANIKRLPLFKNKHGVPAHSEADGSDWTPLEWAGAVSGEVGEAANLVKKVRRGDMTMEEARPLIAKELADVQTYLDIFALQCGVDLGQATIEKFNEVSDRVGCDVKLG